MVRSGPEPEVAAIPDKTFIGLIERGLDFLDGYFSSKGFTVAAKTIERFSSAPSDFTSGNRGF